MASKKISDSEKVPETEDLTLRLGNDKGKRPMMDPSEEERRWKKFREEAESESTARSAENKLAEIEKKVNKLETDLKIRTDKLEKKMDNHFLYTNTCLFCQQGKNLEYFNAISQSLETIIRCLNARTIAPGVLSFGPPKSNAPSSSKGPHK